MSCQATLDLSSNVTSLPGSESGVTRFENQAGQMIEKSGPGSCPCQPFSAAGKRGGVTDARHLWPSLFGLVRINRPPVLFGEQVASKDGLSWLDSVQTDMEAANYSFGALDLCAAGFGAPHIRQRLYFVADSERERLSRSFDYSRIPSAEKETLPECSDEVVGAWRELEASPTSVSSLDGPPLWMARKFVRGYGNALCAPVAQGFIEAYLEANN